jgi:IS30 family transposase
VRKKDEHKTRETSKVAITDALVNYNDYVYTMTSGSGCEFARYEEASVTLDADFFFAHPYSSWERGLNENTNGLIRQYLKKGT